MLKDSTNSLSSVKNQNIFIPMWYDIRRITLAPSLNVQNLMHNA